MNQTPCIYILILFVITKCYFAIRNLVFKQGIGVLMDIDLARHWESSLGFGPNN